MGHFLQYPKGTEHIYSYMESRGGEYPATIFFGLRYYLLEYLSKKITLDNIDEAMRYAETHGVPFNRDGWLYILSKYDGALPLTIQAVREGLLYKTGTVLMTIMNTDPMVPWLTNWFETLLMKVWYPTTVATKSYYVKQIIQGAYDKSSDVTSVDFSYHNFGDRGSTSVEAAMIGGMAHLTQFMGTDNFGAILGMDKYYNIKTGFSIPASEHSTITSWGKENEFSAIENHLEQNKNSPLIACVMDSYDVYKAVDFVTTALKERIESPDYPVFVIRPDSGEPIEVLTGILEVIEKNNVAYMVNSEGYKVLNKYRLIWGDGITPKQINLILNFMIERGYSAENIAFGSGGDLMQNLNRDTCKFAIKCSAARVNGVWRDVYKDPITDPGKKSKVGMVDHEGLSVVYENGIVL